MCQARRTIRTSLSHLWFFWLQVFCDGTPWSLWSSQTAQCQKCFAHLDAHHLFRHSMLEAKQMAQMRILQDLQGFKDQEGPVQNELMNPCHSWHICSAVYFAKCVMPKIHPVAWSIALLCIMQQLQISQRAYTPLPNVRVHNPSNLPCHPLPSLSTTSHLSVPDDLPFLFAVACCGAVSGTWGVDRQFRATCWQLQHYLYFSPVWDSRATSSDIIAVLCLKSRVLASI